MHFSARRHIHTNEAARHASFTSATPRACARAADYRGDWWDAAEDIAVAIADPYNGEEYDDEVAKAHHDILRLHLHGA